MYTTRYTIYYATIGSTHATRYPLIDLSTHRLCGGVSNLLGGLSALLNFQAYQILTNPQASGPVAYPAPTTRTPVPETWEPSTAYARAAVRSGVLPGR